MNLALPLVFVVATATSTSSFASSLHSMGKLNDGSSMYLDLDTIKQNGDRRQVRAIVDFKQPKMTPSGASAATYSSSAQVIEVDCKKSTFAMISVRGFSDSMAKGAQVFESVQKAPKEAPINPGTQPLQDAVCGAAIGGSAGPIKVSGRGPVSTEQAVKLCMPNPDTLNGTPSVESLQYFPQVDSASVFGAMGPQGKKLTPVRIIYTLSGFGVKPERVRRDVYLYQNAFNEYTCHGH